MLATLAGPHLCVLPDVQFWTKVLFFRPFARLIDATVGTARLVDAYEAAFPTGRHRAIADRIIEAAGDLDVARQHLVLVHAFIDGRRAEAIESVALAHLDPGVVDEHRSANADVRRLPLALLLYAKDPVHLLEIHLWDRWHSRRLTSYRRPLSAPVVRSFDGWRTAATSALARLRGERASGCAGFEDVYAFPTGVPDDVLFAFREWPHDAALRTRDGTFASGRTPEWMLLRVFEGGRRLVVTDFAIDRGARLANAVLAELGVTEGSYEPVLGALTERKLREFLASVTDPGDPTFPLVEITATVPWRGGHHTVTLVGDLAHPGERVVEDLRELGPFALNPSTVRSVKVAFENRYRIQVHFPAPGEALALSYSDLDRDKKVCARFAEMLHAWLQIEVPPRARRGTTRPSAPRQSGPRVNSLEWWRAAFTPRHDDPAPWLLDAQDDPRIAPFVVVRHSRFLRCADPFLDRRAVGVDSLDCDGEVVFPANDDDDDPTRAEDGKEHLCSRGEHHWKPARYRLPLRNRVDVSLRHEVVWRRVLDDLAWFGEVRELPGRPGVASLTGATWLRHVVYLPLAADPQERLPATFGTLMPAAWIHGGVALPGTPEGAHGVADVLVKPITLGESWRVILRRAASQIPRSASGMLAAELPPYDSAVRVLVVNDRGVSVDGARVCGDDEQAQIVLLALFQAARDDEADGGVRRPWSWENLDTLVAPERRGGKASTWQTWISRTRGAIADALGDARIRAEVIPSKGGRYQLGVGFVLVDQRVQVTPVR